MRSRILSALAAALLAGALTVGCTPTPEPSPTPTGFATEEEAFAAAEETYRAYVDALNAVDLSDPETFEDVYAWTTGEANAEARRTFTQMHADGWNVVGESRFDSFAGTKFDQSDVDELVQVELCLDVTAVDVIDHSGMSIVPDTRQDRQPAEVAFASGPTSTGLLISQSLATESDRCG